MEPAPVRWFAMSGRELRSVLCAAGIILLALGGYSAWRDAVHEAEFVVYNTPGALALPERIDINTAPAHELQFLPGIGSVLALRIVQYREKHGPFGDMDELQKVSGIGPAAVGRIRPHAGCPAGPAR